jgi:hypothetical protein
VSSGQRGAAFARATLPLASRAEQELRERADLIAERYQLLMAALTGAEPGNDLLVCEVFYKLLDAQLIEVGPNLGVS